MSIGGSAPPGRPRARSATITVADVAGFVERAVALVRRHEALLDRLDAALGDGDHGANMVAGFAAVARDLAEQPPSAADDLGTLLRRIGHTLVASVGGASGPLYGTAFIECGFALEGRPATDLAGFAEGVRAGAAGLARRGRCSVGDKTILDALSPAVDALSTAAAGGAPPQAAFLAAARAARRGAQATVPMIARRGLALRLGERSRGHRDPGAVSCFLLVRAMLDGRSRRAGPGARRRERGIRPASPEVPA